MRDEKRKNIGLTLVLLEGMQQGKKVTKLKAGTAHRFVISLPSSRGA